MTEWPIYIDEPDALVTAAWNGEYDPIRLLIGQGRDLESCDEHGSTALMVAAERGYLGIVELLIEHRANINARNRVGDSAIDLAKFHEYDEIVDTLRRMGAEERQGPSAIEQMWDQIYDDFAQADAVKKLVSLIDERRQQQKRKNPVTELSDPRFLYGGQDGPDGSSRIDIRFFCGLTRLLIVNFG